MIILVGGTGHAGKTYMAQRLLEKYKYPYMSIDHLKMGLFRADIECGFTPEDSSELIGNKLWPMLKGIIMTCVENEQNLVLEGSYLFPQKIEELEKDYLDKIISFYLGFSLSYIEKYTTSKIRKYRSVIEKRGYDFDNDGLILENDKLKEICAKYNAKYFEIQDDYEKETAFVYNWIDKELARKG